MRKEVAEAPNRLRTASNLGTVSATNSAATTIQVRSKHLFQLKPEKAGNNYQILKGVEGLRR